MALTLNPNTRAFSLYHRSVLITFDTFDVPHINTANFGKIVYFSISSPVDMRQANLTNYPETETSIYLHKINAQIYCRGKQFP